MKKLNLKNYKPTVALLLAGGIYGSFPIMIRVLNEFIDGFSQIFLRSFFAFVVLFFIISLKKISVKVRQTQRVRLILFTLCFPFGTVFFTMSVLQNTATASVALLYVGTLVSSIILGKVLFNEVLNKNKVLAMFLAIAGIIFIANPSLGLNISSVVFGLLSGVFDGLTNALRKGIKNVNRFVMLAYQYGIGSVVMIFLALLSKEQLPEMEISNINYIFVALLFGACLIAVGSLTLYGFQRIDLNVGSLILTSELIFATILAFIFLNEIPNLHELLGGLFVSSAIVLVNRNHKSSIDTRN